jgi:hypothetical protein
MLINETAKAPHIGAVTRSRVVKKPKRDLSPPPSPTKKPGILLFYMFSVDTLYQNNKQNKLYKIN